ncbi:hypothetical protein VNO77_03485 [Canavalia gladiata]|uniref:Uncharacterized protein n=1 Tax=Canavalia gladiata TaxID=3824 RepID=A0AAN9MUZ1_CANGL
MALGIWIQGTSLDLHGAAWSNVPDLATTECTSVILATYRSHGLPWVNGSGFMRAHASLSRVNMAWEASKGIHPESDHKGRFLDICSPNADPNAFIFLNA